MINQNKKAAMGPWPSIIGGVIICAIILYILVFVVSGGLVQTREITNKGAYMNFKNMLIETWTEGSSTTTDWKMVGVKGEAWAIFPLGRTAARNINQIGLCSAGQTSGLCVTSRTKSAISKCMSYRSDLCLCLAKFSTGNKDVYDAITVDVGVSLDETIENVGNWSDKKLMPLLNYPVDIIECNLLMQEMKCTTHFGTPCLIKSTNVADEVLVWIGTTGNQNVECEILSATTKAEYDRTHIELECTTVEGGSGFLESLYNNQVPWK